MLITNYNIPDIIYLYVFDKREESKVQTYIYKYLPIWNVK